MQLSIAFYYIIQILFVQYNSDLLSRFSLTGTVMYCFFYLFVCSYSPSIYFYLIHKQCGAAEYSNAIFARHYTKSIVSVLKKTAF